MTPVQRVLAKLPNASKAANGWVALCPAHEDRNPSLSIGEGDNGRALIKCHAGCTADSICAAIELRTSDLMPNEEQPPAPAKAKARRAGKGDGRIVTAYDYRDENGELLFQVVRYQPKDFRQRKPEGNGWDWSVKGVRAIPYCLPELLAEPTGDVFVAEGEKDVDNLRGIGVLATCNAGGAGKWNAEHAEFLRGRRVNILPHNDDAGENHAQTVAESLQGIAEWVRIIRLPGLAHKGDASDWIEAGGTKAELRRLVDETQTWNEGEMHWPDIRPFDVLDLPEFPLDSLPEPLRSWVKEESIATQTPADMSGLLALAVISATLARKVEVMPRPGWHEPVNLYIAVLMESANRKSAVFTDATKPLRELEAELISAARPSVARYQSERRQAEARQRRLEQKAVETEDPALQQQAHHMAEEMAGAAERVLPRLVVDDATSEKLGIMLAEQGGRIASMSPEGGVFDLMAGQYSKSGLPQFTLYLKGHSGDDLTTDRVSRKSEQVERPALTCAYAIQPIVIEGLAENPTFRGKGLLGRFLYALPESWIGKRQIAPPPVSDVTRGAYRELIRRLAGVAGKQTLRLTPGASSRFQAWEAEIEEMLADGGLMELVRDWGGKLAGATLRLAAALHCVQNGPVGEVDVSTISDAVAIARYLIPHADAVLNMMHAREQVTEQDARYVLDWIKRRGLCEFTKSEAQHHGKRRFPKAHQIDPALAELAQRGYVRLRTAKAGTPGRPQSVYDVNPAVQS